jgi:hypothetical protein
MGEIFTSQELSRVFAFKHYQRVVVHNWHPSFSPQLYIFSRELYRIVVFLAIRCRHIKSDGAIQLTFSFMKF